MANINHFVSEMNDEASVIGLSNTHYETPDGVYKRGEYSTASDVAKLLKERYRIKIITKFSLRRLMYRQRLSVTLMV